MSHELHHLLLLDPPCFVVVEVLVSDTLLPASAEGEAQAVLLAALLLLDIFIQKCKKTLPNRPIIQILCISKPNLVHLGFVELWLPGKRMENSIRIVLGSVF